MAGGGPSTPDGRVLRALTTPLIGQFDPDFTAIMDDVVQLGRETFLTSSPHCFAISALASGGLEAVINSLIEPGGTVAIVGSDVFGHRTAAMLRGYGASAVAADTGRADLVVVPAVDPFTCEALPLRDLAATAHAKGALLVVEGTLALAARELRVDEWGIDLCVAGVDYGVGAPSGMSLVTYTPAIQARMQQRRHAPTTQYLDLLQLQAYWSPERLNHHTAPTGLIYGLREALRILQSEGLEPRWNRHAAIGAQLRDGLVGLGLEVSGDRPYCVVHLAATSAEQQLRDELRSGFDVSVTRLDSQTWRLGLLGAQAQPSNVVRVLAALRKVVVA